LSKKVEIKTFLGSEDSAIKNARFSRYHVKNPGFFISFKEQVEVYELLVKEEIHQVIYHLIKDKSFNDAKDTTASSEITMKKPFLISGFEVNQALGNNVFKRVYDINHGYADDKPNTVQKRKEGVDLLKLKNILRDSYTLTRFRQYEVKLNQKYAQRKQ
jgi:hypothetical protein